MDPKLKMHRFDPPGNWRWPCRFSLDELKTIYYNLFGFNWFELHSYRALPTLDTYDVGKDKIHGYSKIYGYIWLEDGGCAHLESCTKEELDWFLFIGSSFAAEDYPCDKKNRIANPLFDKLSRETALITLDLLCIQHRKTS